MKKILILCVCALTYSSTALSFSFDTPYLTKLEPYVGIEAQMRNSRAQQGFGGNVFTKHQPQSNLFLGVKILDNYCLELGRKIGLAKTRNSSLAGGSASGIPVAHPPAVHRGTTKFKDWHAEVMGMIPLYKQDCIALLTSVGVVRANIFAHDKLVQNNSGVAPPTAFVEGVGNRTFRKHKLLMTAGVGLQAAVDEKTYVRARVNWENYSRFKSIIARERADGVLKPRDNFVYSLGVVFKFF